MVIMVDYLCLTTLYKSILIVPCSLLTFSKKKLERDEQTDNKMNRNSYVTTCHTVILSLMQWLYKLLLIWSSLLLIYFPYSAYYDPSLWHTCATTCKYSLFISVYSFKRLETLHRNITIYFMNIVFVIIIAQATNMSTVNNCSSISTVYPFPFTHCTDAFTIIITQLRCCVFDLSLVIRCSF